MIYTTRFIDANIFLNRWAKPEVAKYMNQLDPDKDTTSVAVLAEVYHVLERKGKKDVFKIIRKIMSMVKVFEITQGDLFNAIKNPLDIHINDKLHIAVMKRNGIKTILSYDKGFDKDKTIKREEL